MPQSNKQKDTILLVEDEPVICRICLQSLAAEGFVVETAANGHIAEEMLEVKKYSLILIDIRTPVMNGIELYGSILQKHHDLYSQVIFTSGDINNPDTMNFINQSGRPLLPKPFTPDELKAIIKRTLQRS